METFVQYNVTCPVQESAVATCFDMLRQNILPYINAVACGCAMPFPDFVIADCEMKRMVWMVFFPQQSCLPAFFLADVWLLDDIVDRHCRVHDEISEAPLSLWLATECRHLEFYFLRYCLPLLAREVHNLLYNKGRRCPNIQAAVFLLSRRLQGLHNVSVTPETSGFYDNEAHMTLQLVCICVKQNFSAYTSKIKANFKKELAKIC